MKKMQLSVQSIILLSCFAKYSICYKITNSLRSNNNGNVVAVNEYNDTNRTHNIIGTIDIGHDDIQVFDDDDDIENYDNGDHIENYDDGDYIEHIYNAYFNIVDYDNSSKAGMDHYNHSELILRDGTIDSRRRQESTDEDDKNYYHVINTTEFLGELNYDAVHGNPMKGFTGNTWHNPPEHWHYDQLNVSFHYLKLAWTTVMIDDPDVVGPEKAFNWTSFDHALELAANYSAHVVIRFIAHWPGNPVFIPQFLLDKKDPPLQLTYSPMGELVPYYGDSQLLHAMEQFIDHFARRYDGDTRLFTIQAGLIGYWGEWHTTDCMFNATEKCDPEFAKHEVVTWYAKYFNQTKIQFRYPDRTDAYQLGFGGYHDDSFAYSTVAGEANGGIYHEHFFWSQAERSNITDFWKHSPSGGEVRPEHFEIFTDTYPAGTDMNQDVMVCIETVHTTFIEWGKGTHGDGPGITDTNELNRARNAHVHMGYNFQLTKVAVKASSVDTIDIDATIMQVGVAPFYYPLFLNVYCNGTKDAISSSSIDERSLVDRYTSVTITVPNITTASIDCLNTIELQLDSPYVYENRRIKWAQGDDGSVFVTIPPPPPKAVSSMFGDCYLVCAADVCSGENNDKTSMGYNFGTVSSYDNNTVVLNESSNITAFHLNQVGTQLSIRCDKIGTDGRLHFYWQSDDGEQHEQQQLQEYLNPYAMNGGPDHLKFFPVDYLSYAGFKNVTVQIRTESRVLHETHLFFSLEQNCDDASLTSFLEGRNIRSSASLPIGYNSRRLIRWIFGYWTNY